MAWIRKAAVGVRYGGITKRSVDRKVKRGDIPPPEYPAGPELPLWNEAKLDEHDAKAGATVASEVETAA